MSNENKSPQETQFVSLSNIQMNIAMSRQQLHVLAQQDGMNSINKRQLYQARVAMIHQENHATSLLYFEECQKMLQYGADCGKCIDWVVIIRVLNNLSSAYYKIGSLTKATDYAQAILFNYNTFIKQHEKIQFLFEKIPQKLTEKSLDFLNTYEVDLNLYLKRLFQLAIYYLQFSGLCSQKQSHEDSITNSRKCINTLKKISKLCQKYEVIANGNQLEILTEVCVAKDSFEKSQYRLMKNKFRQVKELYQNNKQNKRQCSFDQKTKFYLSNISLTTIFSIEPKSSDQPLIPFQIFSLESYCLKIIFMAASYFAITLEMQQLIESQKNKSIYLSMNFQEGEQQQKEMVCQIYHLFGIMLGLKFLPFQVNLLQYIHQTYNQNYKDDELEEENNDLMKIDLLKQKYKGYMLDKDISLSSLSKSQQSIKQQPPVSQSKEKRSNKLNELLNSDDEKRPDKPRQKFVSDIPSIQSFEVGNSHSKRPINPIYDSESSNSYEINKKVIRQKDIYKKGKPNHLLQSEILEEKSCQILQSMKNKNEINVYQDSLNFKRKQKRKKDISKSSKHNINIKISTSQKSIKPAKMKSNSPPTINTNMFVSLNFNQQNNSKSRSPTKQERSGNKILKTEQFKHLKMNKVKSPNTKMPDRDKSKSKKTIYVNRDSNNNTNRSKFKGGEKSKSSKSIKSKNTSKQKSIKSKKKSEFSNQKQKNKKNSKSKPKYQNNFMNYGVKQRK